MAAFEGLRSQVAEFSRFLVAQEGIADTTASASMATSWCLQVLQLDALQADQATELTNAVTESKFTAADKTRMARAISDRLADAPRRGKDKPTQTLTNPQGYMTQAPCVRDGASRNTLLQQCIKRRREVSNGMKEGMHSPFIS